MAKALTRVFPDAAALARGAAAEFIHCAHMAIEERSVFRVALSGGSTPRAAHLEIADRARELDWERIEIFWGDERCVSPGDVQSNYRMARETLLTKAHVPEKNIHRWKTEFPPAAAASDYEEVLVHVFESRTPIFDFFFLGLGSDGHTASLFPGSPALEVSGRLAVDTIQPATRAPRVTLTIPVLNGGREAAFLVSGSEKAQRVRDVVELRVPDLPATRIAPERTLWLLDRDAASLLE